MSAETDVRMRPVAVESDTFETPDPPPFVSGPIPVEDVAEEVERVSLQTAAAFDRFRNARLDGVGADFSDSVSKPPVAGYAATKDGSLCMGGGASETLVEKYNRIQHEVQELMSQLNDAENAKNDTSEDVDVAALASKASKLQQQLQSAATRVYPTLPSEASLQLLSSLGSYKAATRKDQAQPSASVSADGGVTYELFYTPTVSSLTQASAVADMERRIAIVEKALGADVSQILTQFGAELGVTRAPATVEDVLTAFQQRLSVLEGRAIDGLVMRLKQLAALQTEAAAAAPPQVNDATSEKINALHAMLMKQDTALASLPEVVARLRALKTIHEQAAAFVNTMATMSSQQDQLVELLKGQEDVLAELEKNMAENMEVIKSNVEALTTRMNSIAR